MSLAFGYNWAAFLIGASEALGLSHRLEWLREQEAKALLPWNPRHEESFRRYGHDPAEVRGGMNAASRDAGARFVASADSREIATAAIRDEIEAEYAEYCDAYSVR